MTLNPQSFIGALPGKAVKDAMMMIDQIVFMFEDHITLAASCWQLKKNDTVFDSSRNKKLRDKQWALVREAGEEPTKAQEKAMEALADAVEKAVAADKEGRDQASAFLVSIDKARVAGVHWQLGEHLQIDFEAEPNFSLICFLGERAFVNLNAKGKSFTISAGGIE